MNVSCMLFFLYALTTTSQLHEIAGAWPEQRGQSSVANKNSLWLQYRSSSIVHDATFVQNRSCGQKPNIVLFYPYPQPNPYLNPHG